MHPIGAIALAALLASTGIAQDVLYYKFDDPGATPINLAARSGIAPGEATINSRNATPPWVPGRFGTAFSGGAASTTWQYVDTGYNVAFQGSFTVAFFCRNRVPLPSTSGAVIFRGPGSNGRFIADVSGSTQDLLIRGFGGSMRSDGTFLSKTMSGWVHVALVADWTNRVVRLYIDGVSGIPLPLTTMPFVDPRDGPLRIGKTSSSTTGSFDIDEFRLTLRAASAAEVQRWATTDTAADGPFGAACHPRGRVVLLDSNEATHGPPAIGNARYALELFGLAGTDYTLMLGTNRLRFAGLPLPLDLKIVDPGLAGCLWHTSGDIASFTGRLDAAGAARLALPVPNVPAIVGINVFSQAVLYSGALSRFMSSNAFVSAIGQ